MKFSIVFILRIAVALILVQTLYFKFSAHPDSVYIFEKVGLEPIGRIAIGIFELMAAALLMIRSTVWLGAAISFGIIGGAIMMHLTQIGIEVKGDGGLLFYLAVFVFVASAIILWNQRKEIPIIGDML